MELHEYSTEDIMAEAQLRIDRGESAWERALSTIQRNYRGMWFRLCDWTHEQRNKGSEGFDKYADLIAQINLIADTEAPDPTIKAVNTTQYGVDI